MDRSRRTALRTLLAFFFRHLYTTLAWSYDAVAWLTSMGQWRTWQSVAVARYAGPVLEIGHGPGHVLLGLERAGNQVTGVDLSRQMVAIARRRRERYSGDFKLVRARAQQLPFKSGLFAAVVATFPTEFILAHDSLREIERILVRDGELIVIGLVEITGTGALDRFAGWLYRFTGQSGEADPAWASPLREAGLEAETEFVAQPRARILRLRARKP